MNAVRPGPGGAPRARGAGLTGTARLTRLALRLDRVRLTVWVLLLAALPAGTAAQYKQLYPTPQALQAVSEVVTNRSLVAISGPLFHLSIGGLTAWKIGATELILAALISLLTVVRHTRAEEENGRSDLVAATVVGRFAPLTAAVLTAALVNLAVSVMVALLLIGTGMPVAGSVALGLAIAATGLLFAGVAAVTAQLSVGARTANAAAVAVLGAAYLTRAVGDIGPTWLSWLSPLGWGLRVQPFGGERWWLLAVPAGFVAALLAVAYRLVARRDLGAGLVPERAGPPAAGPRLRSSLALAWRLHRGTLIGWLVAMAVAGLVFGAAAASLPVDVNLSPQMAQVLDRMGGRAGLIDQFLAACIGIIGLTVAGYAVQATQRMRAEEAAGRLEPLLATPVGRLRWAGAHLTVAFGGCAALLAIAGTGTGLGYALQSHHPAQVTRLLGATLVQLPAVWVLAGLGVALFGLLPRWSTANWGALVACVLMLELGVFLGLNHWLVDASPFAHIPKVPGGVFHPAGPGWLIVVTAVLVAGGLVGLRRRDVG